MSISINPSYIQCKKAGCAVSLEQTEGQCRERHKCGDERCPLEDVFDRGNFGRALAFLLPAAQAGWDNKRR